MFQQQFIGRKVSTLNDVMEKLDSVSKNRTNEMRVDDERLMELRVPTNRSLFEMTDVVTERLSAVDVRIVQNHLMVELSKVISNGRVRFLDYGNQERESEVTI